MVIIITESQLSKILTEQNNFIIKENVDDILTEQYNYQPKPFKSASVNQIDNTYVKPPIIKNQIVPKIPTVKNPLVADTYKHIVNAVAGWGTDPNGVLSALDNIKNQNDFKLLISLFKDKKTGYSSFDEMINGEYEGDNYDDIVKLDNKLRQFGIIPTYDKSKNRFGLKLFWGNFKTTFGKDPIGITRVGPSCKSKWLPHLKRAKDYWIQWFSNPINKSKFKKNWGVGVDNKIDGITVDDLFKKYINTLNPINLVYYDNITSKYVNVQGDYAYVNKSEPTKIYVNCSQDDDTPYETLIHEIQHTLYNIKPLNPSVKIGDVFVNDKTKKMTPSTFFSSNSSQNNIESSSTNIESVAKTYNINKDTLNWWLNVAKVDEKETPGYSCRTTEKMSNIMAIRKHFNLKPGGNITKEMLIPYIEGDKNDTNIYWVLSCWALNGFPDINIMLNKINQLAYQDTKQNNNTRIA